MHRALCSVVLGLAWVACAPAESRPPAAAASDPDAKQAIGVMLDDWHDAAAHADENRYFDHLADDAIFLGTDAKERWDVAAFRGYAHPRFAVHNGWTMRSVRRSIMLAPGAAMAWFDEDLATERLGPARGSGVVAKRGGAWKILHYNVAVTVPNERFDEVKRAAAGPPTAATSPAAK